MANLSPFRGPQQRSHFIAKYDAIMRSWPVPYDERYVETAFGQTHIVVSGPPSAPPLVLFHGAFATLTMWSPIITELSDTYRCYCVDTITDANKSVAVRPVSKAADYVDWMQQILSALGITQARVTGLSYGGWLASLLALHAPERVSHLVLLCPAATLAPLPAQYFARMLAPGLLQSRSLVRRSVQWLSATPDAMSDPIVELLAENLMACRPLRREMMQPTVLTDDDLHRLSARTTVLIGDRDVLYRGGPRTALARAQKNIPGVHTQLLANASHMLTLDCPKPLVTAMLAALAEPASD